MAKTEHLASAVTIFRKNDFSSLTELDTGGEATTYRGRHAYFGDVCAKVFFRGPAIGANHNEVRLLLRHGHHPNVIQLFGLFEDNDHPIQRAQIGYVMEFMPGGSVSSVIYSNYRYNDRHAYNWVSQAAKGLQHLHQAGIIHRDMKPANMLLDESLKKLKISDFGISRPMDVRTRTTVGTHIYMAPEMFYAHHQYGLPVDVYALAISFWEMLYRRHPFDGNNYPDKSLRPPVDTKFSRLVQTLIQQCWNHAAYDRPSVMQIITTIDQHMDVTKPQERITTVPPEEGSYQGIATVSTQRSSRSTSSQGNSSQPQTPATAPVRGNPLAPQQPGPATVPHVEKPRKHRHKKEKTEKTINLHSVMRTEGEESLMDVLAQSLENTRLHEYVASGNVDATYSDILKSTLYAQFLRLPPQQFQQAINYLTLFIVTSGADIENLQQGNPTQCVRLFGIGPCGPIQDPSIFQQLGFQLENSIFANYTECYRFLTFLHFNVMRFDDERGKQKYMMILNLIQELERIYQQGRVPRFLQTTKFNVLILGNSAQLSAMYFVSQKLPQFCQNVTDDMNPVELYRLNLIPADFHSSPCMAVQAPALANVIQQAGPVHHIIYLVDCDSSPGRFGSDWKILASSEYSRLMIGCNSMEEYQKFSNELRSRFKDKDDFNNITPFLKRQNGQAEDICFPRICEMYRLFHSVYRQCVMNLVSGKPTFDNLCRLINKV